MILKIGNRSIDLYNTVNVTLSYDSVASAFSMSVFFDPNNADQKAMFKPGRYAEVTLDHEGEVLITGTLLIIKFASEAEYQLAQLSGYSKTGVLEDCEIPTSSYPLQSDKLSLKEIAEKVVKPFGLKVIIDPAVASKVSRPLPKSTASDSQSIKGYLSEIAGQKHVMVTHDQYGNLVLTEAKTTQSPIFDFTPGTYLKASLDFDGQQMHNEVTIQKQATLKHKGNTGQASVKNPYCNVFRPKTARQTSGEIVDTGNAARNMLSDELKAISVRIEVQGWKLGNKIIRPNNIVTIISPENYIYKKTRLFIQSVSFTGKSNGDETAVINCCLPEVFSTATPINIFD